jgi:DNA-binding MarR family transcriptional regulator
MDLNEIDKSIIRHKNNSPQTYDDVLYTVIPFFIAHKKLTESLHTMHQSRYNICNTELDVLSSLKLVGGKDYILSPTKLYSTMVFSSGGMTKVLKKLLEKEYIIRIDNINDKRSKLVQLTKKGDILLSNALKDVVDLEKKFFSSLDKEEQKTLKDLMYKILEDK